MGRSSLRQESWQASTGRQRLHRREAQSGQRTTDAIAVIWLKPFAAVGKCFIWVRSEAGCAHAMDHPAATGPATSSTATIARSTLSTAWTAPWSNLDTELRNELTRQRLDHPMILAGVLDEGPNLRGDLLSLLEGLGLGGTPELTTKRLDDLTALRLGAAAPAAAATRQLALATDAQLADDLHERKRHRAAGA